jgi:hypothetical protein
VGSDNGRVLSSTDASTSILTKLLCLNSLLQPGVTVFYCVPTRFADARKVSNGAC